MAAAFELRKAGFDITILEANPGRLGGRIYTYYFDPEKRLYGELGAMRLPVAHEAVWHYIDLFSLPTRPFIQTNPEAFIYLQGIRVRNDPGGENVKRYIYPTYPLYPWERGLSWQELGFCGLEGPVLQASPQSRREILEVLPYYSQQLQYLDGLSTRQAMERQGLSQGAVNMLSSLFPIGGRFLSNNYTDFVQEYFPANFLYMYEISGGMVKLPEAFFRSFTGGEPGKYYPRLPSGVLGNVIWKGGHSVKGIYMDTTSGKVVLACETQGSKNVSLTQFDYVVCTIPYSVLRVLEIQPQFTTAKMQAIREVTYSPAHKSIFRCRRRFWEEQGIYGGGSYTDLPANTVWYPSSDIGGNSYAAGPGQVPGFTGPSGSSQGGILRNPADSPELASPAHKPQSEGVLLAYSFNLDAVRLGNLTNEERLRKLERDVEKVHGLIPGWMDSVVTDFKTQYWDRDPYYRGTFSYFTPQQKSLFSWTMLQPEYGNRVFFAGEHTSATHRWMQGALKSGMLAANAVAQTAVGMPSRAVP